MAGKLPMGQKELIRAKIMEQVVQKQITLNNAAVILKISERQVKRIFKRYREEGDRGLLHGVNTDLDFPLFTDFCFPLFGADFSLEANGSDLHSVLHAI